MNEVDFTGLVMTAENEIANLGNTLSFLRGYEKKGHLDMEEISTDEGALYYIGELYDNAKALIQTINKYTDNL